MAYIHLENVSFAYPGKGKNTIDSVSLSIEKGEYVLLCGESGSGKTTLLRQLKPMLTPGGTRTGTITVDGTPLEDWPNRELCGKIGFVMQHPDDQIVTDKVWHELAFGLERLGCEQKTLRLRVAEMASYFGIQAWFHKDISQLSGGQKQLVNLASIMAMQPDILILDEPTSQLDPLAAADFLATLRKINLELGTTIFITEHRLEEIYPAADRVIVMEQGKIAAEGNPRQVAGQLYREGHPMLAALPTPAQVYFSAGEKGDAPLTIREGRNWLAESLAGRPLSVFSPPAEAAILQAKAPALKIKDCYFRYEKESPDVLNGISLTVPQGSLFALVGSNGAGKSTLLKAICQVCRPYRGQIQLFGKQPRNAKELFQNCLAMLPQEPKCLFVKDSVEKDLQEMTGDTQLISRTVQLCRITHLLSSHPWDLSGGELQRAALAKVLLTQPKLLLLDEPTKGIDPFFKKEFAAILSQLKEQGITILLVSHDVEFCASYADQVAMFFDGEIVTQNTPKAFFAENSFYTTAANRMSRCVFHGAVTVSDTVSLYRANKGEC